jgi:hypothetical protein
MPFYNCTTCLFESSLAKQYLLLAAVTGNSTTSLQRCHAYNMAQHRLSYTAVDSEGNTACQAVHFSASFGRACLHQLRDVCTVMQKVAQHTGAQLACCSGVTMHDGTACLTLFTDAAAADEDDVNCTTNFTERFVHCA